ncbi:outer membrane beta-barrel protein [Segetibacter koreensis]|uniref:outer membrane beta-barrel protein n=1 Tax=Segetibacter koreensis TaxID=398037 RepID=UPI000366B304|nr:outer membrane beta-barrel protein [Segetibacter koreensis]
MQKVKVILFLTLSCCFSKIYSQFFQTEYYSTSPFYYEVGGGIGAMNCITDLGGANGDKKYYINEIKAKNFRPSVDIFAGVVYHNYLGMRLQGSRGQIRSSDADIKGNTIIANYKRNRNQSFRTNITEVALIFEFRPLVLFDLQPRKWAPEPYIDAGFGWFSFNPQTQYNGHWLDLKPLHTEGEGFPEYPSVSNYKLHQYNVPIGIGLRYKLSSRLNIRLEYMHRILFTDYLDDASSQKYIDPSAFDKNLSPEAAADAKALYLRSINGTIPPRRGNPNNNDTYMSLTLKLGVILGRESID